jgi:hypothetical protein
MFHALEDDLAKLMSDYLWIITEVSPIDEINTITPYKKRSGR